MESKLTNSNLSYPLQIIESSDSNSVGMNTTNLNQTSFPFLRKQSYSIIRPSHKKLINLVLSLKQKNLLYKTNSDLNIEHQDYLSVKIYF